MLGGCVVSVNRIFTVAFVAVSLYFWVAPSVCIELKINGCIENKRLRRRASSKVYPKYWPGWAEERLGCCPPLGYGRSRPMNKIDPLTVSLMAPGIWPALQEDAHRYGVRRGSVRILWGMWQHPGLFAVAVHRFGAWANTQFARQATLRRLVKMPYHLCRKIALFRAQIELLEGMEIGPGLYLSDRGSIILGAKRIGRNCTIGATVTIGMGTRTHEVPVLGDDVVIGDRAIVYGDISLGRGVQVDSGSVLTKSVPADTEVSGNPARIKRTSTSAGQATDG